MSDHKCTITISKDGSHNYVAQSEHSLGADGEFLTRVIRRRMGQARHMVVAVEVSSFIKSDLLAASVQMEPLDG